MYIKTAIIVVCLGSIMGCGGGGPCTKGQSEACACENGRQGAQLCLEDLTFTQCVCDGIDRKTEGPGAKDSGVKLDPIYGKADSRLTPVGQKKVFVTSTVYRGDLLSYMPNATEGLGAGVAAGDALCQQVADGAMLEGTWIAWLSAANYDSSIHAIDRVQDVGPWYLLNGEKAFNNKANLAGTPLTTLNVDERGQELWNVQRIWTGSKTGGTLWGGYASCSGWMSSDGEGMTGNLGYSDTNWITDSSEYCYSEHHLLCLQQ